MYFTIGGRRVQSGLYRVTYTGSEPTAKVQPESANGSAERALRHKLEAFHGKQDPNAVDVAWPYLKHEDRFIRWAARTVLEHQPLASWLPRALGEKDAATQIEALLAATRLGGVCPMLRTDKTPATDPSNSAKILGALESIEWLGLSPELQRNFVRTVEIAFPNRRLQSVGLRNWIVGSQRSHFSSIGCSAKRWCF